jgi:hypothetical protein
VLKRVRRSTKKRTIDNFSDEVYQTIPQPYHRHHHLLITRNVRGQAAVQIGEKENHP